MYAAPSQIWCSRTMDAGVAPERRPKSTAMHAGRVWLAACAGQCDGLAAHGARDASPAEHRSAPATHDRNWPAADADQRCALAPAARAAAQHRSTQADARVCWRAACADGPSRVVARAESAERRPAAAAGGAARAAAIAGRGVGLAARGARNANFGAVAAVPSPFVSRPRRGGCHDPGRGPPLQRSG